MKIKITLLSSLLLFTLFSCDPEQVVTEVEVVQGQNPNPPEEDPFKNSGFVISSIVQTSAGESYFAGFLEDTPVGNLDLTQFNSFSGYYPQTIYKNFGFGGSLDSENIELNRYAVDNETGQVVKAGSIAISSFLSQVLIINDTLGVYTVANTPSVFLFNPLTMQFLEEITMPNAVRVTDFDDQVNSYFHIIHRPQDNKLFLPLFTNAPTTPQFYDATDIYVEVVDLNSKTWEKTAIFEGASYPITRGMENPIIDEQGNIYITSQGQYSLDGQAGPTAPARSRPQLLKIPAGGIDFDPDYSFNPVDYLGFNFLVAQFVTGVIYGKDGIAYAAISAKEDDPRILELIGKLGAGTITNEEFSELRNLVINGANSRWAKIDLNAKTAEVISDIPFTAGYGFPFSYKYDDKMYFVVFDPASGRNGYYEYDPSSNSSFNIYNVAAGGIVTQFFKLQQ